MQAGATACSKTNICGHASLLSAGTTSLAARPDVEHIAVLGAEFLDPARAGFRISASMFPIDRNQCGLDVRLHFASIAADEDDRALLDQAPDLLLLRRDQMLRIGLAFAGARERRVQFTNAVGGERLQLIRVEKILLRMPASEEQHRRPKPRACRFAGRALLQETTERREPRSRTDHDDRH